MGVYVRVWMCVGVRSVNVKLITIGRQRLHLSNSTLQQVLVKGMWRDCVKIKFKLAVCSE